MKITLLFLLISITSTCFSQVSTFNKLYPSPNGGTTATAVIERADGNYLVAAGANSELSPGTDIRILLVDTAGNIIWDKLLGSTSRPELSLSLTKTTDNNYLLSGSNSYVNPYLVKFDINGDQIWEKEYLMPENGRGYSVVCTPTNEYALVASSSLGYWHSRIFKITPQGDTIWTKKYHSIISTALIQTNENEFVIAGTTNHNNSDQRIAIIKTSITGDSVWRKEIGGVGSRATAIKQAPDSGFVVLGSHQTFIPDLDDYTYLVRTDALGDTIWTRKYHYGKPQYIEICSDGSGYLFASSVYYSFGGPNPDIYYCFLTKVDTQGDFIWQKSFTRQFSDIGNNPAQTSDGGILMTGFYYNNTNHSHSVWLVKLDENGNYVVSAGSPLPAQKNGVKVYPNPALEQVIFKLEAPENDQIKTIQVYNTVGQLIAEQKSEHASEIALGTGEFAAGMYYYYLQTSSGKFYSGKFVRQ